MKTFLLVLFISLTTTTFSNELGTVNASYLDDETLKNSTLKLHMFETEETNKSEVNFSFFDMHTGQDFYFAIHKNDLNKLIIFKNDLKNISTSYSGYWVQDKFKIIRDKKNINIGIKNNFYILTFEEYPSKVKNEKPKSIYLSKQILSEISKILKKKGYRDIASAP
ncbi:MAG: hypothetical protein GY909_00045 [Oligoflexia bacterium]|nr:hypothetical protein [Oligoflexia bacterium]